MCHKILNVILLQIKESLYKNLFKNKFYSHKHGMGQAQYSRHNHPLFFNASTSSGFQEFRNSIFSYNLRIII